MSEEEGSMSVRSNLSSFLKIISSYNSNVLLAALVFLLLVVLFVLLLHFYARFFWSPSHQDFSAAARSRRRRRRNRTRTVTTTRIIPSVPVGGVSVAVSAATSDDKGLDSSVISSIPLFVYEDDEEDEDEEEEEEECVICLGLWEVGDFGRKLRNCGHRFHVECIDMWLSSHSTCPLCRSPVLAAASDEDNLKPTVNGVEEEEEEAEEVRLQLFSAGEDENIAVDRRFSLSLAVMEADLKTGVGNGDGDGDSNGVGEGEVSIEVFDEEINGGGSRGGRRSTSMTSSASSSLMRMLSSSSSRSERNKVFPSARQDSSK